MLTLDNPEQTHIGKALLAHSLALGVTLKSLEREAGADSRMELQWLFQAPEPSVLRIRQFHWWVIEAWGKTEPRPYTVGAFREQWFTTRNDQVLHQQVLSGGRRAVWWWGGARTARGSGALCHVCNELIHTYDLGRGITHPGRLKVMNHRGKHVAALLGIAATRNGRRRA